MACKVLICVDEEGREPIHETVAESGHEEVYLILGRAYMLRIFKATDILKATEGVEQSTKYHCKRM